MGEQIPIRENGRERKISKQRAFIKALVAAAIKGDMRATSALVSFCTPSLGVPAEEEANPAPSAEDIDIIETFLARERKRRRTDRGVFRYQRAPAQSGGGKSYATTRPLIALTIRCHACMDYMIITQCEAT